MKTILFGCAIVITVIGFMSAQRASHDDVNDDYWTLIVLFDIIAWFIACAGFTLSTM